MKKTLILIGLIIGISSSALSQNIKLEKSVLETHLCKRWDIEFAIMGKMKIGQKPGAKDSDFLFKKDGTYNIIDENGVSNTGEWTYYSDKNYVELSINGKVTSRIKYLDKNKLILVLVSEGQNDPPGLPKVEVHYKPI